MPLGMNDPCLTPRERRKKKIIGYSLIAFSICLTIVVGHQSYHATEKLKREQAEVIAKQAEITAQQLIMSKHQDVTSAVQASEKYPLVVMDEQGKIIQWNFGMTSLTGVTKEQAQEVGLQAIMCDPVQMEKHTHGMVAAFRNPDAIGKLTIVNCHILDDKGIKIPVRVSVRIVPSETDPKKLYAIARIDREDNIIEFGTSKKEEEKIQKEVDKRVEEEFGT